MKKMEMTGFSASGFGEFLANLTVLDEDFDEVSSTANVMTANVMTANFMTDYELYELSDIAGDVYE